MVIKVYLHIFLIVLQVLDLFEYRRGDTYMTADRNFAHSQSQAILPRALELTQRNSVGLIIKRKTVIMIIFLSIGKETEIYFSEYNSIL